MLLTSPNVKQITYRKVNYEDYSVYRRNHKLERIDKLLTSEISNQPKIIFDHSNIDNINIYKSHDKFKNVANQDFRISNNNYVPIELKDKINNRYSVYINIPKVKEIKLLRNRLTIIDKSNNRQSLPAIHNTRRDSCNTLEVN